MLTVSGLLVITSILNPCMSQVLTGSLAKISNYHAEYSLTTVLKTPEGHGKSESPILVPTDGQGNTTLDSHESVTERTTVSTIFTDPQSDSNSTKDIETIIFDNGNMFTTFEKESHPVQQKKSAERLDRRNNSVTECNTETVSQSSFPKGAKISNGPIHSSTVQGISWKQDEDYTQVPITLAGFRFVVCERSMLCAGRCIPTRNSRKWPNGFRRHSRSIFQTHEVYDLNSSSTVTDTFKSGILPQDTGLPGGKLFSYFLENLGVKENLRPGGDYQNSGLMNPNSGPEKEAKHMTMAKFEKNYDAPSSSCQETYDTVCFCDDVCVLYGDCCPDVFSSCHQLKATDDILQFISNVWKHHFGSGPTDVKKRRSLTSQAFLINLLTEFGSCQKTNTTTGVIFVSRCSEENTNISLKESCENLTGLQPPPVTVSFPFGDVTFKNKFCAQCHGVLNTSVMKVWIPGYHCRKWGPANTSDHFSLADLTHLVAAGKCKTIFTKPRDICSPRQCDPNTIFKQQQGWKSGGLINIGQCKPSDLILCGSYYYPSLSFYKNVHCGACFGNHHMRQKEPTALHCNAIFHNLILNRFPESNSVGGGILLILDMTGRYSTQPSGASFYICRDNEVFDPYTLTCEALYCQLGSRPFRGNCIVYKNTSISDGSWQMYPDGWSLVTVTFKTFNSGNTSCVVSTTVNRTVFTQAGLSKNSSLNTDAINRDLVSILSLIGCETFEKYKGQIKEVTAYILAKIFVAVPETTAQISKTIIELESAKLFNDTYQIEISNINSSTVTSYRCSGNNSFHYVKDFSFVEKSETIYALVNVSQREMYYPLRNVGFQVILSHDTDRSGIWLLNKSVCVCDTWLPPRNNCSMVKYSLSETLYNGSHLVILFSGLVYNSGNFKISGDEVFVCANFSFPSDVIHQSLTFLVVSCVLTIISILSLSLMLVLYCLFPELCTLPGKMTASLAAAMMLTCIFNLFSLLELHHDYMCPVVAVLNHVIALAQFGWMSAIAVNMALTFGPQNNKLVRTVSDKTLFMRYNLVVYGSSLVIVITSVILSISHLNPRNTTETTTNEAVMSNHILYGKPGCNEFSGPLWAKLSFMGIPYLITFVINLVGFLLTLIGIQQTSNSVQKLGKKSSEKARCRIYLKLSSAMGFSWAISAVSSFHPKIILLIYIYVCLILLQGPFLFLAFMVNHRVYLLVKQLIRSKFLKHPKREDTKSSLTTTRKA